MYDLRTSTVPLRDAEKVVIRVLDPRGSLRLEDTGMSGPELVRFRHLLSFREGIVFVTGPTGSGKTTTLYAAIRELATGEVNITTVEDPVEYEQPGIAQIQVDVKRNLTVASALRAILRQDPDVILVGEIRDLETAEIAVQAAMTGHLVLATLHTNDAIGVVSRLTDLGLDRASIASALRGAVAQRLVRSLCTFCAEPAQPPTGEEIKLGGIYGVMPAKRAVGCAQCEKTGYRGRIPVTEVLSVSGELREAINQGVAVQALERLAIDAGLRKLKDVALERVRTGETSLQEVERVLGYSSEAPSGEERREAAEVIPDNRPHILLVDDDPELRILARTLLEKEGYRTSEAVDGVDAVQRLSSVSDVSLVVLDLTMPKLSGEEVLLSLRSTPATAATPVVVLTGVEDEQLEARLMDEGADDYIRKPIDPYRFVARIRAALRRAGVDPSRVAAGV
jgi:CheY-like chemotaxis protein/nucleoside-triphosphatase THEP1